MRKHRTANNNSPKPTVFDISLLDRRAFELSRLKGFVDGEDDIFDVLSQDHQEKNTYKA